MTIIHSTDSPFLENLPRNKSPRTMHEIVIYDTYYRVAQYLLACYKITSHKTTSYRTARHRMAFL